MKLDYTHQELLHHTFLRVAKLLWIACLLAILINFLIDWHGAHNPEIGLRMALQLLLFTAPSCFIAWTLLWVCSLLLTGTESFLTTQWLIFWFVSFATGYLQWFKLVPWLLEKLCVRRNRNS